MCEKERFNLYSTRKSVKRAPEQPAGASHCTPGRFTVRLGFHVCTKLVRSMR